MAPPELSCCGAGRGVGAALVLDTNRFNPRPARRPGAAWTSSPPGQHSCTFQSSPGPKAGRCACLRREAEIALLPVSILARPEGRALPRDARFRSAGHPTGFNPRPARRPGAAGSVVVVVGVVGGVSILARPEGRALRRRRAHQGRRPDVSILARPEGRALQARHHLVGVLRRVSILARPEGRALLGSSHGTTSPDTFQSSPGPKAGRCPPSSVIHASSSHAFQSSPGPKAGRCVSAIVVG